MPQVQERCHRHRQLEGHCCRHGCKWTADNGLISMCRSWQASMHMPWYWSALAYCAKPNGQHHPKPKPIAKRARRAQGGAHNPPAAGAIGHRRQLSARRAVWGARSKRTCPPRNTTGLAMPPKSFLVVEIARTTIYLLVRSARSPRPMWPSQLAAA